MRAFLTELQAVSQQGGWVFWALVVLAFGIAFSLLSIIRMMSRELPDLTELAVPVFDQLDRRIRFAFVLTGAAPLVGLLGTVAGMLSTFHGLAQSAARAPVDAISRGISEAMITTQTGLLIAVPAVVVCSFLSYRLEQIRCRFLQTESAQNQVLQDAHG